MRMIASRVAFAFMSLIAVTAIVFFALRATGDPVKSLLPDDATAEVQERLRERLGLDQSVLVQYWRYLGGLVRGDLGESTRLRRPALELVTERLPATLQLGATAFVLAIGIGLPLGVYAAYRPNGLLDFVARTLGVVGQAVPAFWLGILLIFVGANNASAIPTSGRDGALSLLLPAVTLGWVSMAGIIRLTRSSMLQELNSDYVVFARSKGISEHTILWRHALKNAAIPVLTFAGTMAAATLTGSVVVETIFAWPGVGRLIVDAVFSRDFPVVQGVILVLSGVYIVIALIIDICYLYLNPRIRRV